MAGKLRLVSASPPGAPHARTATAYQQWLFPHDTPSLLVVFNTLAATESEFAYILDKSQPRYVIDFRSVPRFDFGSLDRKQVFERLNLAGTKYLDLHDLVPGIDATNWDLAAAKAGLGIAFPKAQSLTGPLVCLVESTQIPLRRLYDLASLLPQEREIGWDILLLPERDTSFQFETELDSEAPSSRRKTIFISHANPEDNDFVVWLRSRLLRAGYDVWADIANLSAGETTWDEIERQIRFSAVKVVVVLSKASQSKQGVLDEINLAVSVERSRKLADFVIPIKLDQLNYVDVRANLARKNIINFAPGWSAALAELLDDLRSSGVKRDLHDASTNDFRTQFQEDRPSDIGLVAEQETLDTNWLPIERIPPRMFFAEMSTRFTRDVFGLFPKEILFVRHQNFIGSFVENIEAMWPSGVPRPKRVVTVDTEELLKEGSEGLLQISALEARKRITSIFHKAWKQYALSRGMLRFEMSGKREVFAMPSLFAEGNRAEFVDESGITRTRKLVGRSEKRKVGWHLAIELAPRLHGSRRFIYKSHVLFSDSSGVFIPDASKQHALRRSFCKSWWNDRWRTLMLASTNWLALGQPTIELLVGGQQYVSVRAKSIEVMADISLSEIERKRNDESLFVDTDEGLEEEKLEEAFDEASLPIGQDDGGAVPT